MDLPKTSAPAPRLRRTILLGTLCLVASVLGMFLARPLTHQFQSLAPWILPALAVGVLALLVILALIVLPRLSRPRA